MNRDPRGWAGRKTPVDGHLAHMLLWVWVRVCRVGSASCTFYTPRQIFRQLVPRSGLSSRHGLGKGGGARGISGEQTTADM